MEGPRDEVDLALLRLRPGAGRTLALRVRVGELEYGRERYAPGADAVDARLDVSRTTRGHVVRLRAQVEVRGPCTRCLEPVVHRFAIEAREIDEHGTDDEQLRSPYVTDDRLDLTAWLRDEIALALPERFRNEPRPDGRCPACDRPVERDDAPAAEAGPDPRWAKLRELEL